jgi:hypothetical protein
MGGFLRRAIKAVTPYGVVHLHGRWFPDRPPWNPEGKPNPRHLWEEDETFCLLHTQVKSLSACSIVRLFMLYQFAQQTRTLPGDVAEFGVYRGGSARLILETLGSSDKKMHLFDTFEGFPEEKVDSRKDWNVTGETAANLEEVRTYLADYNNCVFHQGIFPETAEEVSDRRFCFVHVDADLYQSVKDSCEFFYPRLTPGGVMIFDDYGFWAQAGSKKAVDEFLADRPEYPCYLQSGQCILIKQ